MAKSKGKQLARRRRGIQKNGRSAPVHEPFASIPARLIASNTYRGLSNHAIRVHLLLEAAYSPFRSLILPHAMTCKLLRASDTTIVKAKRELVTSTIARAVSAGIRPGTMGGQSVIGRAAVFELPHRCDGPLPADCRWRQNDGPACQGSWRVHSAYLRSLVAALSGPALRVFVWMHAADHTNLGAITDNAGRAVKYAEVGLTKPTCARAILELIEKGMLEVAQKAAGSRPATYRLCGKARGGVRSDNSPV